MTFLESGFADHATSYTLDRMGFYRPDPNPDEAWLMILEAVRRASADQVLGWIGAGPLESLLSEHGEDFIDRMEQQAANDERFHFAVSHCWQFGMTDNVWSRVHALKRDDVS
jgi:hypothetical protein